MVAVKSHEAERFLARPPPHIYLYLVFGPDAGLVTERARKIISRAVGDPKDPFQLVRIAGDELANDPLLLADEANTIPLFGGRRAISIEAQGKTFVGAFAPILGAPPRDCTIVIEAGALQKDAPLRTLCERERNAAAIQCYPDSAKDIAQLIDAEVGAAGLSIAPDAKAFLVSQLGQDRLSTRNELEKLVLYAHGAVEITLDHVAAIICDASNLIVNEAADAAFDGGFAALDAPLRHIFAGASDYHALLAAALRHALELHRARRDPDDAPGPREVSGFAGAGFKQKEAFERHMRAWTRPSLGRVIDTLAEAIASARREPKLGPSLTARALWKIAHTAASKTAGG
jgi:DNA polymerase III subunit delta